MTMARAATANAETARPARPARAAPWPSSAFAAGSQHESHRHQERRQGVLARHDHRPEALPPVMAAAATAASAVGGLTSDSTA